MANEKFGEIEGVSSGEVFADRAALAGGLVYRSSQAGI